MRVWQPILAAIETSQGLDRQEGRRLLLACWQATSPDGHAQRCVLAHYLADLEPDLADEVRWDERALAAYAAMSDGDLAPIGVPSAAGFAPSLHLNLGDGYLRQGRVAEARRQLEAGSACARGLGDDGYARMIRGGLEGLAQRLAERRSREPDGL